MNPEASQESYPEKSALPQTDNLAREPFSIPVIRWGTPRKPCEDIISELTTDPNANNHRGFRPTVIIAADWPYQDDANAVDTAWFNEQTARRMQYYARLYQTDGDFYY